MGTPWNYCWKRLLSSSMCSPQVGLHKEAKTMFWKDMDALVQVIPMTGFLLGEISTDMWVVARVMERYECSGSSDSND